jgi:hypothetical protein
MTGEGLDSSLTRCFFSLIMDLARSYIEIFGLDGVIDSGVLERETGESGDDKGVDRISAGGFEGIGGELDGVVEGIRGGCWIRTAGGVGGINGGGCDDKVGNFEDSLKDSGISTPV